MKINKRILPLSAIILAVAEVALTLFSWVVTSIEPSAGFRSVLSGEGLRWFFGSFVSNLLSPLSVWLVLVFMAYGTYVYSGLKRAVSSLTHSERLNYRHRHALYTVAVLACVIVFIIIVLAFVPHAVLLGISGSLFPSAFSSALIPIISFSLTVLSLVYGMASGRLSGLCDIYRSLYAGIYILAPFVPAYILAVQLYYTAEFVFF